MGEMLTDETLPFHPPAVKPDPKTFNPIAEPERVVPLPCSHCGEIIARCSRTHLFLSAGLATRYKFIGECRKCGHQWRWLPIGKFIPEEVR